MSARPTLPADALPVHVNGSRSTVWWGMLLLITIEVVVFLTMIVTYFYLRERRDEWPIGGLPLPDLLLPTINLVIILASIAPMYLVRRANQRGNKKQVLIGLALGGVLAVAWLVLATIEYAGLPYSHNTNAYGSLVWTTTWLYAAFVLALVLYNIPLFVAIRLGHVKTEQSLGVNIHVLHWFWVVASWPFLYATIYLSPYVLGTL